SDKGCSRCHGEPPNFAGRGTAEDPADFAAQMWNKAPAMIRGMQGRGMTVPEVEPDEMADLVAYLYSAQYFAASGDPARGRALVRSQGCLACHSLNGAGAGEAGDLGRVRNLDSYPKVLAALWGHLTASGTSSAGTRWPSLSAEQMADVSAYLLSASRSGP
ncbi:MAG TPA: c-type cytochrome, partial [Gemmatimonadota bacterium]|nr:c-type cytochrome [Gemmatimonadota bacterium]